MKARSYQVNLKLFGRNMRRHEHGSFTIEASLVFPIIFILMLIFLFFSIVVYQRVTIYYVASQAAERVAFTWNNSYKDPITGDFLSGNNDGLYWRLTNDNILDVLNGVTTGSDYSQVSIENQKSNNLPEKKLMNVAKIMPDGLGAR